MISITTQCPTSPKGRRNGAPQQDFSICRIAKVIPGVAVHLEARHAASARWKDFDCGFVGEFGDGDDVPDIVRDDVADDEVNVAGSVSLGPHIAAGVKSVSIDGTAVGGLDLNAPDAAGAINDEIVTVTLTPRLGDAESQRRGLVEECGFGDLSSTLGGEHDARLS
jgi:hypothetical protein